MLLNWAVHLFDFVVRFQTREKAENRHGNRRAVFLEAAFECHLIVRN
jgi:hypothetical protein